MHLLEQLKLSRFGGWPCLPCLIPTDPLEGSGSYLTCICQSLVYALDSQGNLGEGFPFLKEMLVSIISQQEKTYIAFVCLHAQQ